MDPYLINIPPVEILSPRQTLSMATAFHDMKVVENNSSMVQTVRLHNHYYDAAFPYYLEVKQGEVNLMQNVKPGENSVKIVYGDTIISNDRKTHTIHMMQLPTGEYVENPALLPNSNFRIIYWEHGCVVKLYREFRFPDAAAACIKPHEGTEFEVTVNPKSIQVVFK